MSELTHVPLTASEIAEELRKLQKHVDRTGRVDAHVVGTLARGVALLADRVAALESREEVRHRIKPIMQGEKPEKGVGGT